MGEDFFSSSMTSGGKMAQETIGLTKWVALRLVVGLTPIRHSMRNGGESSILTATRVLRIGNTVQSQTRWDHLPSMQSQIRWDQLPSMDQFTPIAVVRARGTPTVPLKADRAMMARPKIITKHALLLTTAAAPVGD